jgi:hypothetical protein
VEIEAASKGVKIFRNPVLFGLIEIGGIGS